MSHTLSDTLEPSPDCPLCPRLAAFRHDNRVKFPDYFNAPVPCFGPLTAQLAIVGLAPGLHGANRTGRPFTGDYAGDLLYATLLKYGFARGVYAARVDDGFELVNARIVNSVRCVPPQNKPLPAEISTCRTFLKAELARMPDVKTLLCLGRIAHDSALRMLGAKGALCPFGHAAHHQIGGLHLFDSYHCSRYNTNTGRLTDKMFEAVFEQIRGVLPPLA